VITAIVLVETEVSQVPEAAARIAELDGVSEVYSVTGDVDLVVMVRVREHEDLAGVIADQLGKIPGVRSTKTYLAFRAYSRHDLDAAFALGLEAE
jgi:DNA-binding Lrp family transcriptional regulator